jgi:glucosamine 6-phosphate synthetase-like amidotransferase/phosphosugar isomerase protein
MCGVLGFAGNLTRREWALAHRLMAELAIASEERGTDAAGFAALTANGQLLWQRQPGPARHLFLGKDFAALRRRSVVMAIGHTRLATTGAPAVNGNNHPHLAGDLAGGPAWAVVHNGFIPLHERKAAALGLRLKSQCDSELLVQVLDRYGEAEGPDVCLALGGKQSVLAINVRERAMLAWTNGEMPLVAFRVEGMPAIWWASTKAIAEKALRELGLSAKSARVECGTIYRLEVEDRVTVARRPVDLRQSRLWSEQEV